MILFIDTHESLITIALKNKDQLFVSTQESEYSHSVYTMPMIENIFKKNNLSILSNNMNVIWFEVKTMAKKTQQYEKKDTPRNNPQPTKTDETDCK